MKPMNNSTINSTKDQPKFGPSTLRIVEWDLVTFRGAYTRVSVVVVLKMLLLPMQRCFCC